ncbi:hypothetical protein Tco_0782854 [Tanacetum coccineum]
MIQSQHLTNMETNVQAIHKHVHYTTLRAQTQSSLQKQFCDGDLEVAFWSNTCYVRNLEGEDLLTGSRDSNIYTFSISELATSSPVCLISKATSTKSWLWNRRLSHLNFGPGFNCSNFQDSSEDSNSIPSKEDLDNLFRPVYEGYYATRTLKVSYNSAANTLDNEDTPSSSSIVVEENEAPQIVTSSKELVANKPTTTVSNKNVDESIQEDLAAFDRNNFYNPFNTPVFEEAESSLTF